MNCKNYNHNKKNCKIDNKKCHKMHNQKECSCFDGFLSDMDMDQMIERKQSILKLLIGKEIIDVNFKRIKGEDSFIETTTLFLNDGSTINFGAGTRYCDCGAISINYDDGISLKNKKQQEIINFINELKE